MPFRKISAQRLPEAVVAQLELLILRGILRQGERLPSERDLAERLGVSRPSLREAIADLTARGLLVSRPGSGVYVAEVLGSAFAEGLVALFARHEEAAFDYLDFRADIEGIAAARAARLGSETDLEVIGAAMRRMERAHEGGDAALEADLDAEFHMAIIEASHNVVMLHMLRSMFQLLRDGVFYNRQVIFGQKATGEMLLEQHRAINAAIQARDPAAARAAVEAHLGFIREALSNQRRQKANEQIARLRLRRDARRASEGEI